MHSATGEVMHSQCAMGETLCGLDDRQHRLKVALTMLLTACLY